MAHRLTTAASAGRRLALYTRRDPERSYNGTPCLVWTRPLRKDGYAAMWHDGRSQTVHRVVWQLAHGPIPPGVEIDHRCFTRHCAELAHLRATDHAGNIQASVAAGRYQRALCKSGRHVLTETREWVKGHGWSCGVCFREKAAAYQRARRAQRPLGGYPGPQDPGRAMVGSPGDCHGERALQPQRSEPGRQPPTTAPPEV